MPTKQKEVAPFLPDEAHELRREGLCTWERRAFDLINTMEWWKLSGFTPEGKRHLLLLARLKKCIENV